MRDLSEVGEMCCSSSVQISRSPSSLGCHAGCAAMPAGVRLAAAAAAAEEEGRDEAPDCWGLTSAGDATEEAGGYRRRRWLVPTGEALRRREERERERDDRGLGV